MNVSVFRPAALIVFIAMIVVGGAAPCKAQNISLNDAQRARLVSIVNSDRDAQLQYRRVREQADQALDAEPHPLKQIQSAGRLQSDPVKQATQEGLKDMGKILSLAIVYAVSGDPKCAAKAKQFVLAWAATNKPTGQPIDETNLEPLFIGYDLVRKTFSDKEREQADKWVRKVAEEEISNRKPGGTVTNNWNSHRLKIVGLAGFLLGDNKLIKWAVDGYKEQVKVNLRPDGSSLDLEERDALHYHCYDLEPLLVLDRVAQLNGVDLYNYSSPKGASVQKSVQFALPYADGTKQHAEFVNSRVAFDRQRGAAGEQHYVTGSPFDPLEARKMVELDWFFDPTVQPLVIKLYGGKATKYASFQEVFMDAEHAK